MEYKLFSHYRYSHPLVKGIGIQLVATHHLMPLKTTHCTVKSSSLFVNYLLERLGNVSLICLLVKTVTKERKVKSHAQIVEDSKNVSI